jgi:hypothetical protein
LTESRAKRKEDVVVNYGESFTFMFDDPDWIKKIGIGAGLTFFAMLGSLLVIGVVLFFPLFGYMINIIQNVSRGDAQPLPEWDNWGDVFAKGGMLVVISLVYNIPTFLVLCAGAIAGGGLMALSGGDETGASIAILLLVCTSCLTILISLAANLLLPGAIIRYARYENLSQAFKVGEVFRFLSENVGTYIIVILLLSVAGFIANTVGALTFGIGMLVALPWSYMVTGHLFGQLARLDRAV